MAKTLLVDTNFSSEPIYKELLAMDHEVHVVGANPEDCLAKISPNYWHLNYSDTGELSKLVDQEGFEYLVPGCTDRSYESCVVVSRGRFPGLDSSEVTRLINNKAQFRSIAGRLDLPVPKTQDSSANMQRWPIIVKPVDAFSGKGMTILQEEESHALATAINTARDVSPSGEFLIEDFVEGQLCSHTAFLENGRICQDFVVREDHTANPFVVDTSRVLLHVPEELLTGLRHSVETLATELELVDGLLHSQFITRGTDFWLIEVTRRCPGDLYSQLIELSTEFPYARSYTLPFLGQQVTASTKEFVSRNHPIMRHTLSLKSAQGLSFVRFKYPLLIERWVPLSLVGDQLKPSPEGRIGILFCRGSDHGDLEQIYQRTLQRDLYQVHE